MNRIRIADVTIKESCLSAKSTLSFKEKMEVAKQLDLLMTDVIEMPKAVGQTESLLVKSLAPVIKNSVLSVEAGLDRDEVDKAMAALANAKNPRICISVPTSPVQMEYVCGMKPKKILELVPAIVSYAKTLCPEVEFSCKDATRSEKDFLCKVILSAVKAGATLVDLEDTAGVMLPEEFDSLMDAILAMLKEEGENVEISVTCSDNLNMATANAVTCIRSGAVEVKTSLIGKVAPGLEAIVNMVTERGDSLEVEIAQKRPEVEKTLRKLFWMEGSRSGGTSVFEKEETKHEELDLDENADISKVIRAIRKLGYELSDDDNAKVYKEFK